MDKRMVVCRYRGKPHEEHKLCINPVPVGPVEPDVDYSDFPLKEDDNGLDREGDDPRKDSNPKDETAGAEGRVPLGLLPDTARVAGAMAMHEGAQKYGRYNYRAVGVRASVYHDALMRHMTAWWNGEDIDPDSGLPHTWKALACIAILIDSAACDMLTDDRPPSAPVARMLKDLKPVVTMIEKDLAAYSPKQYTIADSDTRGGQDG